MPRHDVDGGKALEALLRALHPESERAAEKYEEIRERLVSFCRWRRARWPDEVADETIDRVARRLAGGEVIRAADVGRYFLGVARNVLRESWEHENRRAHDAAALAGHLAEPPPAAEPALEARLDCLDRCLAELPADTRHLVLRYYRAEGAAKIEDRRILATQLGVTPAALRIRLHRLRLRLEGCVRKCMGVPETFRAAGAPSDEDAE